MSYSETEKVKISVKFKFLFILIVLLLLPISSYAYAKFSTIQGEQIEEPGKLNSTGLQIRSVDTQIISKHWHGTDRASIRQQASMIRNLGANYVAISTPYDYPEEMTIWADEIHKAGLNVWFRSHWLDWEGDENHVSSMTAQQYLDKTYDFVASHPVLFKEGDAFTFCVEPEQVFVARKETVFDWYSYNKFIIDQVDKANMVFSKIGLPGKVHTNWISMNGWVVENGLNQDTVNKLGLITVDHYPDQEKTQDPALLAAELSKDLTRMHDKWDVPIILGEWGYNITREVPDNEQKEALDNSLTALNKLPFLVGFNYWSHMGGPSKIILDKSGSDLRYRPAANTLQEFFKDVK